MNVFAVKNMILMEIQRCKYENKASPCDKKYSNFNFKKITFKLWLFDKKYIRERTQYLYPRKSHMVLHLKKQMYVESRYFKKSKQYYDYCIGI